MLPASFSHAGVAPEQSPSVHARHLCVPVSQMGVVPEHDELSVHAAVFTHVSSARSLDLLHVGFALGHCALAVHTTHWPNFALPESVSQCDRAPLHATPSSAAVHARHPGTAVAAPSQMMVGAVPMHAPCELDHTFCTV